ncbi:MmcQ/YjbR family DNA-binding protein [Streptomyces albiaxialis]
MVSEEELRSVMLSLPGVFEVPDWGMNRFRVRGRTFVTVNGSGTRATARIHVSRWLRFLVLDATSRRPFHALPRPGWIRVDLSRLSVEAVRDVVREAHGWAVPPIGSSPVHTTRARRP